MIDAQVVQPRSNSLPVPTLSALLSESCRRRWRSAVAPLVALLLLAPSICWVLQDRSVWPWDQAYYGEVTVELYYTLRTNPAAWPAAMMHAIPSKPPGLTWLGQFFVPLGKKIGSIDHTLIMANLLLQFITLLLIYRIGKALSPNQGTLVGLAGCAIVAAAPLFIKLSHEYMTEPLQTLAVTWFFYCALMSPQWGRLRILNHLVAATAVAMLAKTTTPLYCLLPGLMATIQLLRRRPLARTHARSLVLAAESGGLLLGLVLLIATVVWYRVNWEMVRHHAYIASVSDIALDYGHKDVFLNKLAYWFGAAQVGLFTPPLFWMGTFLTLVGLIGWCSRLRRLEGIRLPSSAHWLALLAALHVAGVLVALSLTINEAARFLTAVLPVAAVLLMWAVGQVPFRAAGLVLITLVLVQWGYLHAITLGLVKGGDYSWLVPVDRDPTRANEVTRVIQLTSAAADRHNIVGIELPWCNYNTFAYYAAKHKLWVGRRVYYTGLGYAEKDVGRALCHIDAVNPVYFISLEERDQPKPPDFLNLVSFPVLAEVRADRRYERLDFASESGILVFRRTAHAPHPPPPQHAGESRMRRTDGNLPIGERPALAPFGS